MACPSWYRTTAMANAPTLEEQLRAIARRIAEACMVADSYVALTYTSDISTRYRGGPCRVTIEIGKPIPTVRASAKTFDEAADQAVAEFLRFIHEGPPL